MRRHKKTAENNFYWSLGKISTNTCVNVFYFVTKPTEMFKYDLMTENNSYMLETVKMCNRIAK